MTKYVVVYEQGPSSIGATVPDLPGCVAVAPTLDEARTLIAEAIEFHIEGMRLHGEDVPLPTVAGHPSDEVDRGTGASILKQANLK